MLYACLLTPCTMHPDFPNYVSEINQLSYPLGALPCSLACAWQASRDMVDLARLNAEKNGQADRLQSLGVAQHSGVQNPCWLCIGYFPNQYIGDCHNQLGEFLFTNQ